MKASSKCITQHVILNKCIGLFSISFDKFNEFLNIRIGYEISEREYKDDTQFMVNLDFI